MPTTTMVKFGFSDHLWPLPRYEGVRLCGQFIIHLFIFTFITKSLCSDYAKYRLSTFKKITEDKTMFMPTAVITGKPINVSVQVYFVTIDCISQITMDYSLTLLLQMTWVDPRVAFSTPNGEVYLIEPTPDIIDKMWVPDIFFPNSKKSYFHDVPQPNKMMLISPNGTIVYNIRVSLLLYCQMNLRKFPFDNQYCKLHMESISHNTKTVNIKWHKHPFIMRKGMSLPAFDVDKTKTSNLSACYKSIGCFSVLECIFTLSRNYGNYISQVYVPSALIVCLSWVSFWLDAESTPARITLGLLTVLTLTQQSIDSRINLPRVSYVKGIDVWMGVCLLFVFGALMEFAIVNVQARADFWNELGNTDKSFKTVIHTSLTKSEATSFARFQNYRTQEEEEDEDDEESDYESTQSKSSLSSPSSSLSSFDIGKGLKLKKMSKELEDGLMELDLDEKKRNYSLTAMKSELLSGSKGKLPRRTYSFPAIPRISRSDLQLNTSYSAEYYTTTTAKGNGEDVAVDIIVNEHEATSLTSTEIHLIRARKIDENARFMFPVMFLGFNVLYWTFYMNWKVD